MTPNKSALVLFTTASAVVLGTAGIAWLAQQHPVPRPYPSGQAGRAGLRDSIADAWTRIMPRSSKTEAFKQTMGEQSPMIDASPAAKQPPKAELGLVSASADASQNAMIASQKLIRTGRLTLEVKLFDEAFAKLQRIASENGGYIADIKANRQDRGLASGTVVVRVQPTRYFQTLDALRAIGRVEQVGVNTQDVTKEFADLEARLTNKRQLESRMREILRTRSAKMEDLLLAEQQLSQVTEQIEQMEGERRYFQQMVSLSTITVELHEAFVPTKAAEPAKPGLFAPVAVAARSSIELLVQLLALLVSAVVFLAPWVILGAGAWAAIRRMAIRKKGQQEG